ncbi:MULTISPECIES: DUF3515 domain-containing protein [Nocardia]|uniref:DUF3515 domain-containing protein n=1 Tax=Nocardia TaxID=1817 RepID=UPI0003043052|nr:MULTISPECIES: DUF3515 domain-containing protein [Nocardia]
MRETEWSSDRDHSIEKTDSPAVAIASNTGPAVADAGPQPESSNSDVEQTDAAESGAESDSGDTEPTSDVRAYPPALIATTVALPVMLIVAVLVAAVLTRQAPIEREPLALGPVPAPAATGPECTTLLPAMPAELGEYTKSTLVEPVPPATRAWQRNNGGDPIVLRCGLDRPLEFDHASALQIINDVQWCAPEDARSVLIARGSAGAYRRLLAGSVHR